MDHRRITFVASLALVAFLANSVATGADPVKKPPAQPINLRPAMKAMAWQEGKNVVHKGTGHTLIAEVKGTKIVGWSAVDGKGNPLQTTVAADGNVCKVCISNDTPGSTICYEIDCDKIVRPTPPKSPS